mmetsp:Transcript_53487/g.108790  ORF Transcript_53487/g.108790 Transcript_53487/m.108790 type:complete len:271 (-) Transcript_53487:41-853(-)
MFSRILHATCLPNLAGQASCTILIELLHGCPSLSHQGLNGTACRVFLGKLSFTGIEFLLRCLLDCEAQSGVLKIECDHVPSQEDVAEYPYFIFWQQPSVFSEGPGLLHWCLQTTVIAMARLGFALLVAVLIYQPGRFLHDRAIGCSHQLRDTSLTILHDLCDFLLHDFSSTWHAGKAVQQLLHQARLSFMVFFGLFHSLLHALNDLADLLGCFGSFLQLVLADWASNHASGWRPRHSRPHQRAQRKHQWSHHSPWEGARMHHAEGLPTWR